MSVKKKKAVIVPAAQGKSYAMKFYFILIIKIIIVEVALISSVTAKILKIVG